MKKFKIIKRNMAKGNAYANKKARQMFMCLGGVMLALFLVQMFLEPTFAVGAAGSGLTMASLVALASIDDVSDRDTHGSAISYIVYLYHVSIIDRTQAFPQPNGEREVAQIPLVENKYPIYFEAHDIPTLVSNTEKGDITTSGENIFTIILGGDRDQIKSFIEEYSGGKFVLVYKHVKENQWHILGELERPMILRNTETKDDKDGRYTTFTFGRTSVDLPCIYTGNPTTESQAEVEDDDDDNT